MTRYAYVENMEVVEIHGSLPTSWKNYSNFNLMNQESLRELGWLPIVEPTYVPIYNSMFERLEEKYDVFADRVEATYKLKDYSSLDDAEMKEIYMSTLRFRRTTLLQGSDWAMLPDMIEMKGENWKTQWSSYRQSLRDFPSEYENKSIRELPDLESLPWPQTPSL